MKPLTMSIAAGAVLMAGAAAARAQSIEVPIPSIIETEGLPRLPNYFRDCWEPLPAYCVRPPGLLWFGNPATVQYERGVGLPRFANADSLQRERRALRVRGMHAAVSK